MPILALVLLLLCVAPARAQAPKDPDAARRHWAFQPVQGAIPEPAVRDVGWSRDPIDRFVLARLEAEGLTPGPDADRRTWIRRVTFDLTGLPPTLEEVEDFVADASQGARETVVDRLLASPAYGERAARAWLDLARYADSNGLDENLAFANAWRYRDWVVRALNADLRYDTFVTMQLAGDLLPPTDDAALEVDRRCATGFLSLGPKVLAEQDKDKLVMDIVDEQIDVLSKTVLGLTVSCARCHDHKFDPVAQRDYYALAGVLKSTATMEDLGFVSKWREVELATAAQRRERDAWVSESKALDAEVAAATEAAVAAVDDASRRDLAAYLLAGVSAAHRAVYVEAEDFARGNLRVDREQWGSPATTVVHTGQGGAQWAEWELDVPATGSFELQVRFAAKESRPVRLTLAGRAIADRALAETTGDWFPKDQRWFSIGTFPLEAGRVVLRLDRGESIPHIDKFVLVPAGWPGDGAPGLTPELVRAAADFVAHPGRASDPVFGVLAAFAALPEDTFADRAPDLARRLLADRGAIAPLALGLIEGIPPRSLRELCGRYQAAFQVVDRAWRAKLEAAAGAPAAKPPDGLDDPDQEQLRRAVLGPDGVFGTRGSIAQPDYPEPHRARLAELKARRGALDQRKPEDYPSALGVVDGKPADVPIHLRGNHLTLAPEPTPRGAIALFDPVVPPPSIPSDHSGRLELARWLCDPRHPLTARVMVNRIWQVHFGAGLVRTPSNFGLRGEAPSHPELLDRLAHDFVAGGWSIKALHRRIALSRTYGLACRPSDAARAADPEDRLLSWFPRRRLPAEAIRDGVLAVAGTLDRTMGGTLLRTANRGYVTNDQSNDQAHYDTARRSLYLPLIRNAMYDEFTLFDYNDASVHVDHRPQTAVPIQALWLLNSEVVHTQGLAFARRVLREVPDDPRARIDRAFRLAYARPATESEIARTLDYVGRARATLLAEAAGAAYPGGDGPPSADERAWALLCQVLFASNEFLHVD